MTMCEEIHDLVLKGTGISGMLELTDLVSTGRRRQQILMRVWTGIMNLKYHLLVATRGL